MERFVVLLVKGALSSEEQNAFFHCVKICHPCEEEKNYCNVFAPHFSPFMEQLSLKVAVIRALQHQNPKDVTWNKVELNENICELLNSETPPNGSSCNPVPYTVSSSLDEASYFPEVLHSLADQLPVDGTYNCDIIISQDVLEGKILRDHIDFAAALCRFHFWHNAKILVVRKDGHCDDDSFLDWYESIDSHIITAGSGSSGGTILWRGGIQIGSPNASDSVYIPGFQLELQTMSDIQTWSYIMDAASLASVPPVSKGALIVSSKLEVLDDCDLSTIPPYVLTPLIFHLSLTPCYNANEEACQFFQFVKSRPQAAFILRLQYSQVSSLPRKNTKISDKWNDFSNCNDALLYDPVLPSPKKHLNLVLTRGDCTEMQSAVAYLMKDVDDIKGDFYHNIAVSDLHLSNTDGNGLCQAEVTDIFNCVPHLNVPFSTLTNIINEAQLNVLNAWQDRKKSVCPEDGSITLEEVRDICSSVQDVIYSKFVKNSLPEDINSYPDSYDILYEPVDLSTCPEKTFLMQQQILRDKNKEYNASDTLGGLPPPTVQKSPATVSANDVTNFFTSSGEAKNLTSDAPVIFPMFRKRIRSYTSVERAQLLKWPDVLRIKCHDMYYNHTSYSEDLEATCSKTVLRCITNETAATCYNRLLSSNTPLLANGDMSSKENCFPQSESVVRGRNGKRSSCEDEFLNFKDCELSKKKLNNRTNSSSSAEDSHQMPEVQNGNNFKCLPSSHSVSLRRSPRKLARVNYKQSQNRTQSKKSEPIKASDDLSEKHKMKLRDAVAAALEQHGVGLDHPSFKPCGRKLFAICKAFVKDVIGKGSTSAEMKKIALAHAKQVVEFEMEKGS